MTTAETKKDIKLVDIKVLPFSLVLGRLEESDGAIVSTLKSVFFDDRYVPPGAPSS